MSRTVDELRLKQLDQDFPSHLLKAEGAERYTAITEAAKTFARFVIQNVPWSVDRDSAVQRIREAAMYAKEAILVHDLSAAQSIEITTNDGHKIRFPG